MRKKQPENRQRNRRGVTPLLSTILLLAIAITLVTLIYTAVLKSATERTEVSTSTTNLAASITQNKVTFVNRGGDIIDPRIRITLTINQHEYVTTVGAINNNKPWLPGEEIIYNSSYTTLIGLQVEYSMVDPSQNSVIIHGLIQEGEQGNIPYIQTIGASQITAHTARLTANYNFISSRTTPQVRIQIKTDSALSLYDPNASWSTLTIAPAGPYTGTFTYDAHDLLAGQRYVFRAQLKYSGLATPKQGLGLTFTTPSDRIGEWNFDSTSGPVIDSVSSNNGLLLPNTLRGPRYGPGYVLNAMQFDGIDDKVNISDSNSLDVTDEMTFETWVKPMNNSNGSALSLTQTSSSQFFDTSYGCYDPNWISLGGEYYAYVSRASNNYGWLTTVRISDGGTIYSNATTCVINKASFTTACANPKIIAVAGATGIYAIVYTQSNYGYIRTVSISGTGKIGSFLTNLGFSTPRYCYSPDIVFVGSNTYAIVYGSSTTATSSYGYIQCVSITGGGTTVALKGSVFSMTHDSTVISLTGSQVLIQEPEMLELEGGSPDHYFVIAYKCRDDDGGVYVVQINPSTGAVTRVNGERKFDSKRGENPEIFYITGKFYGVVYGCEGASSPYNDDLNHLKGYITIIRINNANGQIYTQGGEETSHYVFGGAYDFNDKDYSGSQYTVRSSHVLCVGSHFGTYTYVFSYTLKTASGTKGFVRTIGINPATPYSLFTRVANFSYDVNTPDAPDIVQVGGGPTYAIIEHLGAAGNNGLLKTLTIQDDGTIPAKPILDAKEIGVCYCYRPRLLRLSDTYCAMVYQGFNTSGFLKTFYAPASGTLPLYYNDSLGLEPGVWMAANPYQACYEPFLFRVSGSLYAVVYRNYTNQLVFSVGQINSVGQITSSYRRVISGITCTLPVACTVDEYPNVCLVAYRDYSTGRGKLLTIQLTGSGSCMLANASLDGSACTEPVVYRIGSGYYAVAYSGVSSKGELKTVLISNNGRTISLVDEYVFTDTTRYCNHPDIVRVNQTLFAVTFSRREGTKYSSVVFTVPIRVNGSILKYNVDNLTYNFPSSTSSQATVATNPMLLHYGNGRNYLVVYKNNALTSGVASIRIGENGNITEAVDTSLGTSADSYDLSMVYESGNRYLEASGTGLIVRAIRVTMAPVQRVIFSKANAYELYANATTVTAKVYDTGVHVVSTSLGYANDWNYVVLTYKAGRFMNLTVNGNESGSAGHFNFAPDTASSHLYSIRVGTAPLYFGEYNAWFDEFSLWGSAFSPSWIRNRFHNPNA